MSRVVLMGSGETAPAMVKTHRAVLESCPAGAAVMLDTPYGFQVNADDLDRPNPTLLRRLRRTRSRSRRRGVDAICRACRPSAH